MRERDIFIAALDREDPKKQAAYIADACGDDTELSDRVARLLEQHVKHGGFLLDGAASVDAEGTSDTRPGQQIGQYKLVEKLGEGGFGEVWWGEQELPVRRTVAIKVIKLGMDTKKVIARFESERQALALMNHPNIATVLDAGATDAGRPFFVMELVRGVPITDYCDAESLDTRQRLDLFTSVCRAVQHAHQRGVIHRDLKPSNILVAVEDGVATVKVIDFGIAKATNAEHSEHTHLTEDRQIVGTPVYMSPEQAEMGNRDIDTRCDVYSLGVLLYELLTGATPFDASTLREAGYGEMLRIIREEEPKKPSTRMSLLGSAADVAAQRRSSDVRKLGLLFRGDLDWIVMRCLEKDRTRGYASAKELSDEIHRNLHDEPVNAGPPTTRYRLQKFVRRNRGVVIATVLVMATMVAGIVGTSIGLVRALDAKREADASRELAERRTEETESLVGFYTKLISNVNLSQLGTRITNSLIDEFDNMPQSDGEHSPTAPASPLESKPNNLNSYDKRIEMVNGANIAKVVVTDYILAPAVATAAEQFSERPLLYATILHAIGETFANLSLFDEAEEHLRSTLDIRRRELPPESIHIGESAYVLVGVLFGRGEYAPAEAMLREVKETCEFGMTDAGRNLRIQVMSGLGSLEVKRGAFEAGELLFREALEAVPNDSPERANLLSVLAAAQNYRGNLEGAESSLRQAIEMRTQPEYAIDQLRDMGSLGAISQKLGKIAEAEKTYRQVLEQTRRTLGDKNPQVAIVMANLADVLRVQERFDEAEPLFLRAISVIRKTLGDKHEYAALAISNLAVLLGESGREEEAEARLREVIAIRRGIFPDSHPTLAKSLINHAAILQQLDRLDEAEVLLVEVVGMDSGNPALDSWRKTALTELIKVYDALHKKNPREGYDAKAKELRAMVGDCVQVDISDRSATE